jgi:hypothetical protein
MRSDPALVALLGEKNINGVVEDPHMVVRKRRSGGNGEEIRFTPHGVALKPELSTLVLDWTPGEPATQQGVSPARSF